MAYMDLNTFEIWAESNIDGFHDEHIEVDELIAPIIRELNHNLVLAGYNDLASRFPEIAAEWSDRNLPLTPDKVTVFKNTRVWWKCSLVHE